MFGVYIHFPYCRSVCPYCDFNSHVVPAIPHAEYADAIIAEVLARVHAHGLRGRALESVYFGGGTPGLWEPRQIRRVLDALAGVFVKDLSKAEVTVEVNPGSVDARALPELRGAGVNRLSIGVQSLHDRHLRRLGRLHSAAGAQHALEGALALDFRSVSIDFMYGLPDQPLEEWRGDLARIAALGAPHVSAYQLTVEAQTPLADWVRRGQVAMPDNDTEAAFFEETRAALRSCGYDHYEVSNFARTGHRAVHNSIYWQGGEWLGVGAGAHGFLRTADTPGAVGLRWADVDDPADYMRRALAGELPEAWREHPDVQALAREELMSGVRWLDGLDLDAFAARTGIELRTRHADVIARLGADGLAHVDGARLALTERGLLLLNEVVRRFFAARAAAPLPLAAGVRQLFTK